MLPYADRNVRATQELLPSIQKKACTDNRQKCRSLAAARLVMTTIKIVSATTTEGELGHSRQTAPLKSKEGLNGPPGSR